MTLDEVITRLQNFQKKVGDIAVETMKAEVPSPHGGVHVGDRNYSTGNLHDSIKAEYPNAETIIVGTEVDYAGIVVSGRKTVEPVRAKVLRWDDIGMSGAKATGTVFAMRSKAVAKNPFDERTVEKLNSMTFEL